jgi:hypothetical protein
MLVARKSSRNIRFVSGAIQAPHLLGRSCRGRGSVAHSFPDTDLFWSVSR